MVVEHVVPTKEEKKKLSEKWSEKPNTFAILETKKDDEKPLSVGDIYYDLNNYVPRLFIRGKEVGVVLVSFNYLTKNSNDGNNIVTFVYISDHEEKVLSIEKETGKIFHQ